MSNDNNLAIALLRDRLGVKLSGDKHARDQRDRDEAKAARDDKSDKIQVEIKDLCNHQYGVALKLNMENSDWKAEREPTEKNVRAAKLARKLFEEHEQNQINADSRTTKQ